jgi:hypothetical protein
MDELTLGGTEHHVEYFKEWYLWLN